MNRIVMAVALIGAPLTLLAATPPARAQDFNQGGPAGCYDPARVTPQQRRQLESWGTPPCSSSRSTSRSSASTTTSWYGDQRGAIIQDRNGQGFAFGVLCDGGKMALSLVPATPAAERMLAGLPSVDATLIGNAGVVTITLPRQSDGDYWIFPDAAQLAAVKAANGVTVTAPRWTVQFTGRGSATKIAGLACRPAAPAAAPRSVAAPTAAWLIGGWVPQGAYCASDSALVFKANGSYFSGGESGRWSVKQNTVTFALPGEAPNAEQLTRVGQNDMILANGRFKRCPPNGGEEPWHPGERF